MSSVIQVRIGGDASGAKRAFEEVGDAARPLGQKMDDLGGNFRRAFSDAETGARDAGEGFDRARDAADNSERRIMGFRDAMTGTGDVMKGLRDGDMLTFATGLGDLASAVANLGVDLIQMGAKAIRGFAMKATAAATATAAILANMAAQVAAWVVLGAQSLIHAAKVAAAWLIAMGPIGLIIAAVVGLVALIIIHFDTIKEAIGAAFRWIVDKAIAFKDGVWIAIQGVLNFFAGMPGRIRTLLASLVEILTWPHRQALNGIYLIVENIISFFTGFPGRVSSAFSTLANVIKGPFQTAFNAVKTLWNNTVGGFGFSIPSWVPGGVGGKSFNIPRMHTGGLVQALPGEGREVLRLLEVGEVVVPKNKVRSAAPSVSGGMGGGNVIYLTVNAGMGTNGAQVGREIVEYITTFERSNGKAWRTA